jgi:spore coat polysaccharide biosynthesis predicted glycosyltransferase SpsG/RimJ/RimL family protein N-acetyltransferase
MKAFIVTEGYKSTGYGHITRCLSLYQAFEERKIFPAMIVNGDENAKAFLGKSNYLLFDWINEKERLFDIIKNSDVVIVDSYKAELEIYSEITKLTKYPVFIDDNLRLDYPVGTILNGTINAENLPYTKTEKHNFLLDSKYIPIRKEFWNVPENTINAEIKELLITFGGQDIRNLTLSVSKAISEIFPELKQKIVLGKGFGNKEEIENLKKKNVEIIRHPDAGKMRDLMLSSDITITAAGQTLYELAVTGSPSIAVMVAGNQKINLIQWKESGFINSILSYEYKGLTDKIVDDIRKLMNHDERKKISEIGKSKVDGQGARRVIQYLIDKSCRSFGFYLRKVVPEDSKQIFELSNDPEVRNNSINRNKIKWEDHQNWFTQKLKNNNYIILLALDRKDNFIGQVRFEIEKDKATVSISIMKDFRGKGFSKNLLVNGCKYLFNYRESLNKILAYIRPENRASIKGFDSAGFSFYRTETINGDNFYLYTLNRQQNEN